MIAGRGGAVRVSVTWRLCADGQVSPAVHICAGKSRTKWLLPCPCGRGALSAASRIFSRVGRLDAIQPLPSLRFARQFRQGTGYGHAGVVLSPTTYPSDGCHFTAGTDGLYVPQPRQGSLADSSPALRGGRRVQFGPAETPRAPPGHPHSAGHLPDPMWFPYGLGGSADGPRPPPAEPPKPTGGLRFQRP